AGPMEVKAYAQLGAHQGGVAEPAKGACEIARKSGDSRLEKRTTLLTNTVGLLINLHFNIEVIYAIYTESICYSHRSQSEIADHTKRIVFIQRIFFGCRLKLFENFAVDHIGCDSKRRT
ncbi:hypothetical protein, partial [Limnohabitans sp. Rim28]|uniref:hypothetical protein n=1 Tax=Limnohabitans sp. Rim28 TaxID=1100720 RepID=UPI000D508153